MADFHSLVESGAPDGLAYLGRVRTAGADFLNVSATSQLPTEMILKNRGAHALKITQGRGAGQVRVIAARSGSRIAVREPWAVVRAWSLPAGSTKHCWP